MSSGEHTMCDKEEFTKLRNEIHNLQISDMRQSEQIKTLFETTKRQGEQQDKLTSRLVLASITALFLALLAVIYGAIGGDGFSAVTASAQQTNMIK